MYYKTLFVICCVVFTKAEDYQDSLKKLWNEDSENVHQVTSASIVMQPSRFSNQYARDSKMSYNYKTYAFKPRAIPTREEPQVVTTNYYTDEREDNSERLFPGNYIPIATGKGEASEGRFFAKTIPLIRTNEYQRRSLDVDEPIIEKPEGFSEASESQRSISYLLGEENDDYSEYEDEEVERQKFPKNKLKPKKLKKYMLPLLLAYKMKYFALVPMLIAGLVLLVGATGLAGFFFALFAAVMGLQKGSY